MPAPASEKARAVVKESLESLISACAMSGFACDVLPNLEITKLDLTGVIEDGEGGTKPEKGATATVVTKLTVTENMCNLGRNMHGGCQAFLLDFCTSLAVMALRQEGAWETSGVTTSLTCNYLKGIPLGTEVLLVSTMLSRGSRLATVDFRIEDAKGTLYSQGTHTKVDDTQQRRARKAAKL